MMIIYRGHRAEIEVPEIRRTIRRNEATEINDEVARKLIVEQPLNFGVVSVESTSKGVRSPEAEE